MLNRRLLLAAVALATLWLAWTGVTGATTPEPQEPIVHMVQVLDASGQPVPDGSVIKLSNGAVQPPANQDQAAEAAENGYCVEAVVTDGVAEVTPEFDTGCPEYTTTIVATIFPAGSDSGIVASIDPVMQWRRGSFPGEGPYTVTAQAVGPNAGGAADEPGSVDIVPPSTGDAGLVSTP